MFMSRYKYEKEFLFSGRPLQDVEAFLESREWGVDLMLVRDHEQSTVVHHCAYHNQHQLLTLYLTYHRKQLEHRGLKVSQIKRDTKLLLDAQNQQGYAPVHFAGYRGHTHILRTLQKYEADMLAANGVGMGMLHLAAQGDRPSTVLMLHPSGLPLNATDHRGSTPLHWAAFSGSHKTVEYLLAQPGIRHDQQDRDGHTPLHLAATYGHSPIVKQLLLAGARRGTRNLRGLTALDIARENEFDRIVAMLDDRYSCMDRLKFVCNAKVKYQPQPRSATQPACFGLLWMASAFLAFGAVSVHSLWLQGTLAAVFLVILGLFLSLARRPIAGQPQQPYECFTEQHQVSQLCMTCIRITQPRQRHCFVCGVCVPQYDHHCPWIGNCVGKHNIARFYLLLILLMLALLANTLLAVSLLLMRHDHSSESDFLSLRQWVRPMPWLVISLSVVSLIEAVLFVIPLGLLILVQTKNLLLGRTTFERFSKGNASIITGDSLVMERREERGASVGNCLKMCGVRGEGGAEEEKSESTKLSWMQQ